METDTSTTMSDILKALKELKSPTTSLPANLTQTSSSTDLPRLEDVNPVPSEPEDNAEEENAKSQRTESPVFNSRTFVTNKRKATSQDDDTHQSKKAKVRHQRSKSSTPSERQEQRNRFTSSLISVPDWLPHTWNVAAYVTNRFFWVHEAARHELYKQKKTKGQNYPCYRVPFNELAISFVKEYDDDRQKLYDAKKSNPDLALVEILPWYKLYSNAWKRPMIHPNSAKTSTQTFAFHTNITFMDNFLDDIGGKLYTLENLNIFPMRHNSS